MENQCQARELITIYGIRLSLEPIEHRFVQLLEGFHPFRIRSKRTDSFFDIAYATESSFRRLALSFQSSCE